MVSKGPLTVSKGPLRVSVDLQVSGPPRDSSLPVQAEDLLALDEDELHDLGLVDHVDRHVAGVQLGPHERGAEHDAEALRGHQVPPGARQNPERHAADTWEPAEPGLSTTHGRGHGVRGPHLSRWVKSTFMVSWLGCGRSWIRVFIAWTLSLDSLISVRAAGGG